MLYGITVGLNNTPNSFPNLSAFGQQFGFSFLYLANKKYGLQANLNYYNRATKIILEKYDTYSGKAVTSFQIKYNVFEIPILVHYKLREKENGSELKLVFGASVSFNKIKNYGVATNVSSSFDGFNYVTGADSVKAYSGQNMTGNLIVGISKLKKFRKEGKQYYSWTIVYQKALKQAPMFELQGIKPHHQQAYHIQYAPYLDALSLTFTYFLFSTKVK